MMKDVYQYPVSSIDIIICSYSLSLFLDKREDESPVFYEVTMFSVHLQISPFTWKQKW